MIAAGITLAALHARWRGFALPPVAAVAFSRSDHGSVDITVPCAPLGIRGNALKVSFANTRNAYLRGVDGIPLISERTRRIESEFLSEEDGPALGDPDPINGLLKHPEVLEPALKTLLERHHSYTGPAPASLSPADAAEYAYLMLYMFPTCADIEECLEVVRAGEKARTRTEIHWYHAGLTLRAIIGSNWFLAAAGLFSVCGLLVWRGSRHVPQGHCLHCGYDLRATPPEKPCPECGNDAKPPGVTP